MKKPDAVRQIIQRFIYLQKHVGQQHFLQR